MAGGADRKHAILPCRLRGFDEGTTAALESHVRSVPTDGPVAQLGARLNGIQEVTGSIPVRSTILHFVQSGGPDRATRMPRQLCEPPLALPDPGQVHLPHPSRGASLGHGSRSAISSGGRFAPPVATTTYCLPFSKWSSGPRRIPPVVWRLTSVANGRTRCLVARSTSTGRGIPRRGNRPKLPFGWLVAPIGAIGKRALRCPTLTNS
jgi:hypothetical protein